MRSVAACSARLACVSSSVACSIPSDLSCRRRDSNHQPSEGGGSNLGVRTSHGWGFEPLMPHLGSELAVVSPQRGNDLAADLAELLHMLLGPLPTG